MTENDNVQQRTTKVLKVLHVDDIFDPSHEEYVQDAFHELHTYLNERDIKVIKESRFVDAVNTLNQNRPVRAVILDLKRDRDNSFVGIDLIIALNNLPAQQRPRAIVYTRYGENRPEVQQAMSLGATWIWKSGNKGQNFRMIYDTVIGS